MKTTKQFGICKICGQYKYLTAEHIPPKNAFNSSAVIELSYEEAIKVMCGAEGRLPWDLTGLRGSLKQGGHKKYCLCQSCNNNTGQWYMRSYTDLSKVIHTMIVSEQFTVGSQYAFVIKNLYPLRIYKAMMTMIRDLNNNCLGDEKIRQFLLNKEEKEIDISRYSLYMYLVSTQMPRMSSVSATVRINDPHNPIIVSEVAQYPIGFALYIDKPATYTPFGLNADIFASFNYDEKCDIHFDGMPYLDINTQFPADYRSKDDIIKGAIDTAQELGNSS